MTSADSPQERGSRSTGQNLVSLLADRGVTAELLAPGVPTPTVSLAAAAIGVEPEDIIKSLLFVDRERQPVLAIVNGNDRVDRTKLAAAAGYERLSLAGPDTVLRVTGYPAGGVPPVCHASPILVVVHAAVLERPIAYGGAGTESELLSIAPRDIVQLTNATIANIV